MAQKCRFLQGAIDGCFMDGCANYNPRGNRLIVPGPLTKETASGAKNGTFCAIYI